MNLKSFDESQISGNNSHNFVLMKKGLAQSKTLPKKWHWGSASGTVSQLENKKKDKIECFEINIRKNNYAVMTKEKLHI